MKSNTQITNELQHWARNQAVANVGDASGLQPSASAGSFYAALHSSFPGRGGTQSTGEITYAGTTPYARVAVSRATGFTVTGQQLTLAGDVTFPNRDDLGSQIDAYWVTFGYLSTGGGTIYRMGAIGGTPLPFTAKSSDDSLTVPGHSLVVDDKVWVYNVPNGTLPTGLTEGTIYFVKTVSGNDITLAATQGGSTINLTGNGAGKIQKLTGINIGGNNQRPVVLSSSSVFLDG